MAEYKGCLVPKTLCFFRKRVPHICQNHTHLHESRSCNRCEISLRSKDWVLCSPSQHSTLVTNLLVLPRLNTFWNLRFTRFLKPERDFGYPSEFFEKHSFVVLVYTQNLEVLWWRWSRDSNLLWLSPLRVASLLSLPNHSTYISRLPLSS